MKIIIVVIAVLVGFVVWLLLGIALWSCVYGAVKVGTWDGYTVAMVMAVMSIIETVLPVFIIVGYKIDAARGADTAKE
jgi:uncharacterized membrane protein